jgi:hypothetical protein
MAKALRIFRPVGGQIFGQQLGNGDLVENPVEVGLVDVVEIVADDVFDRLGEPLEDVQVLGKAPPTGDRRSSAPNQTV